MYACMHGTAVGVFLVLLPEPKLCYSMLLSFAVVCCVSGDVHMIEQKQFGEGTGGGVRGEEGAVCRLNEFPPRTRIVFEGDVGTIKRRIVRCKQGEFGSPVLPVSVRWGGERLSLCPVLLFRNECEPLAMPASLRSRAGYGSHFLPLG